jgi:large subunit ribosomal protein L22
MGKPSAQRQLPDNEAKAVGRMIRTSPQKLNLVAQLIRGKKAERALSDLTFSRRRIANDVKKVLESAIANAENNHNLDVDSLVVAEAYVGKNLVMKRFRARAKGRAARIIKPFSQLTIVVPKLRRKRNGSEGQSDWHASGRQPHMGVALVCRQGRICRAPA